MRVPDYLCVAAALVAAVRCTPVPSAPPPPQPPPANVEGAAGQLRTLRFPDDIEHRLLANVEARRRFVQPKDLMVQGSDAARIGGDQLLFDVWVTNPLPESFVLVVWPFGGSFPYGGDNPLTLAPSRDSEELLRYDGEIFPPSPPMPMEIVLPERSRVLFTAKIDLGNYDYDRGASIELEWAFHYFEDPSPSGSVVAQLP